MANIEKLEAEYNNLMANFTKEDWLKWKANQETNRRLRAKLQRYSMEQQLSREAENRKRRFELLQLLKKKG